jgi:hypothetical protein
MILIALISFRISTHETGFVKRNLILNYVVMVVACYLVLDCLFIAVYYFYCIECTECCVCDCEKYTIIDDYQKGKCHTPSYYFCMHIVVIFSSYVCVGVVSNYILLCQ